MELKSLRDVVRDCLTFNDVDAAIAAATTAAESDPSDPDPQSQLAHLAAVRGDWQAAHDHNFQALTLASALDPITTMPKDLRPVDPTRRGAHGLPIVVIYRHLALETDSHHHLPYCLAHVRETNPTSSLFLVGDGRHRSSLSVHVPLLDVYSSASDFAKVYRHKAFPVRYDFMLFSFQRLFVLRDLMERLRIDEVLHIDPDVLLCSDASQLAERVPEVDFAISANTSFAYSPHYLLLSRREPLDRFCEFMLDLFANARGHTPLRAVIDAAESAYLTDMHALEEFVQLTTASVWNLSAVHEGGIWDANVCSSDGFAVAGGMKDLHWRRGCAFAQHLRSPTWVRFHAVHYNHAAKPFLVDGYHHRRPSCQGLAAVGPANSGAHAANDASGSEPSAG